MTASEWVAGENKLVEKVSLDPAKVKDIPVATSTNGSQSAAVTKEIQSSSATTTTTETPAPITPATNTTTPSTTNSSNNKTGKSPSSSPIMTKEQPSSEASTITTATPITPSTSSTSNEKEKSTTTNGDHHEGEKREEESSKPKKKLPHYGSAHASAFKYISGKLYHPSTHYDDLRGLSIDKSGNFDLIQASTEFIGVPISGAGGRVGIIPINKPGRLPTQIPCVLCGSNVTNFKFDPFDPRVLATVSEDNCIRLWRIPENGLEEDTGDAFMTLKGWLFFLI